MSQYPEINLFNLTLATLHISIRLCYIFIADFKGKEQAPRRCRRLFRRSWKLSVGSCLWKLFRRGLSLRHPYSPQGKRCTLCQLKRSISFLLHSDQKFYHFSCEALGKDRVLVRGLLCDLYKTLRIPNILRAIKILEERWACSSENYDKGSAKPFPLAYQITKLNRF